MVAKGEQKPPQNTCSPRASPDGLVANWSIKACLGTALKWPGVPGALRASFSAKMVVQPLGEVLSPIRQKLRSAASGDHNQSQTYLDCVLSILVTVIGLVYGPLGVCAGMFTTSLLISLLPDACGFNLSPSTASGSGEWGGWSLNSNVFIHPTRNVVRINITCINRLAQSL